jgi:methylamine--corrinoid protein Co-methyltransferase
LHFLELEQRSRNGEALDKESFDLDRVAIATAELVEKYELTWDREVLLPYGDDDLLRRFYSAGRELLISSGVYNLSTGRVIRFTENEIDEAAANQRQSLTMGQGQDAFTLYARKPEDTRKPGVFGGNPGCPTPERIFKACVQSWAQEPAVDLMTCGSLVDVDGYPVRLGEPSELYAVRRELRYLNQVTSDIGRPGMGRLAAESAVSEIGDLAAFAEGFIRKGDAHLVALNNELITNRDTMLRAANAADTGVLNASLACVMVEGLAGGAPGAAVVMIASMLAANIICRADYHLCHPIHLRYTATSTRECMWLQSVVCQAFNLCAPNIIVCDIYPKSGAMTPELLYETAANALAITVSGGHLEGVGSCDGLMPNGTGLEARLMGEVGRAASQGAMTRKEANGLLMKLLEKYEHVFAKGNPGVPFDEASDPLTVTPKREWLAMYEEVKKQLNNWGLTL